MPNEFEEISFGFCFLTYEKKVCYWFLIYLPALFLDLLKKKKKDWHVIIKMSGSRVNLPVGSA